MIARDQARRGKIALMGRSQCSVERAGYHPVLTAENVESGQKTFSQAMRGWEGSPEHKRNLLLPDAEAVGVAVSYRGGRAYWTIVIGAGQ